MSNWQTVLLLLLQADSAEWTAEVRHCCARSDACAAGVRQRAAAAAHPAGAGPRSARGAHTQAQGHREGFPGRSRKKF
jgi:hypothetical protein